MNELDGEGRSFLPYRSTPDEQTAGDYNSGDRKCRMATLGRTDGVTDKVYPHAMAKSLSISSTAGKQAQLNIEWVAQEELRGDYSGSSWTYENPDSSHNVMHHQFEVKIGEPGSMAAVSVTDFEINVDIPLQIIQDTESGLYIAEPKMEGKYGITGSMVVTRHTADTWMDYRDDFTDISLSIIATFGSYQFKILLPNVKCKNSSISDDEVANVPLEFEIGTETTAGIPSDMVYDFEGHELVQGSGLSIITNNLNSINEMRRE